MSPYTRLRQVSSWGFVISPDEILQTAKDIGEPSVLNRAGGAPTLAVGIAMVFHKNFTCGRYGLLVSLWDLI